MGRASDAQKAERLNHARDLLRQFEQLPDAVGRLASDFSISPRQAYRYLQPELCTATVGRMMPEE